MSKYHPEYSFSTGLYPAAAAHIWTMQNKSGSKGLGVTSEKPLFDECNCDESPLGVLSLCPSGSVAPTTEEMYRPFEKGPSMKIACTAMLTVIVIGIVGLAPGTAVS